MQLVAAHSRFARERLAGLCSLALACASASRPTAAPPPVTPAARPSSSASSAEGRGQGTNSWQEPAWLRDLEIELSALRGLPFKRAVPFSNESRSAFRAEVRSELGRELPSAKSSNLGRAYRALGFVAVDIDLAQAMEDALVTEVAAYYDPKRRAFKFVGSRPSTATVRLDTVAIHELAHALQDQHFDLEAFSGDETAASLDDDQRLARRFLVEGEATFLMMAHDLGSGPPAARRLGSLAVAGLRMNITMLAAADMLELLASVRQGHSADRLDAETRAELTAIEKLPPLVTLPMIEPYLKGALFVSEVWAKGGWAAVDDLYRHPPDSSEQVLHPTERFLRARDPAVSIRRVATPPPWPDARLLLDEVVGELGWRVYFKTWNIARGPIAAAGWGGDRMWAWAIGDRTVACIATRWDSEADAREFVDAYEESLATRFPDRPTAAGAADGFRITSPNGDLLSVERRGRDVDVIAGVRPGELVSLVGQLRAADRRLREPRP